MVEFSDITEELKQRQKSFSEKLKGVKTKIQALQNEENDLQEKITVIGKMLILEQARLGITSEAVTPESNAEKEFAGLTIADAIEKVLAQTGPLGGGEILKRLKAGGLQTEAKQPHATIYSALKRNTKRFEQLHDKRWTLRRAEVEGSLFKSEEGKQINEETE